MRNPLKGFDSKEELQLYHMLNSHLNGWATGSYKGRALGRKIMAKRRALGLTQEANLKYLAKNRLAISMYGDLMKLAPELVRKGEKSFGRPRSEDV